MSKVSEVKVAEVDHHPIQVVARRTGLSADLLRAWEKRYSAVTPRRTATGRRLYSSDDIARLLLLRGALDLGRSIGQVAHLPTAELEALIQSDRQAEVRAPGPRSSPTPRSLPTVDPVTTEALLDGAMAAVGQLDHVALERTLQEASVQLPRLRLLDQFVVPFLVRLGERWHAGELRPAHEHLAAAVVRNFVGALRDGPEQLASAPRLIATTPTGQLHELGALMAATTARSVGWRATYLGPNLPAEDIVAAARQLDARAVALSLVYRTGDPRLYDDLRQIRRGLAPEALLIVGGRGTEGEDAAIVEAGAMRVQSQSELSEVLERAIAGLR